MCVIVIVCNSFSSLLSCIKFLYSSPQIYCLFSVATPSLILCLLHCFSLCYLTTKEHSVLPCVNILHAPPCANILCHHVNILCYYVQTFHATYHVPCTICEYSMPPCVNFPCHYMCKHSVSSCCLLASLHSTA